MERGGISTCTFMATRSWSISTTHTTRTARTTRTGAALCRPRRTGYRFQSAGARWPFRITLLAQNIVTSALETRAAPEPDDGSDEEATVLHDGPAVHCDGGVRSQHVDVRRAVPVSAGDAVGAKRRMSSAIVQVRTVAPVACASSSMASARCWRRSRMMQTRSRGPMFSKYERRFEPLQRTPVAFLSRRLVGRVSAEELRHTEQSLATMYIPTPRAEEHRIGRQRHDLFRYRTGVEVVATRHHHERNLAGADEVSVDAEDKVTAEHAVTEGSFDPVVHLRMGAAHLICPLVEHRVELRPVLRSEANWILGHRGGDAI